jgi:hypothetical protein
MSFAGQDHAAAIADLIAIEGKLIEINGRKVKAHIIEGNVTQEASEFGLDNRDQELTAIIVNRNNDQYRIEDRAIYKGIKRRVTQIDPSGDHVLTITLEND